MFGGSEQTWRAACPSPEHCSRTLISRKFHNPTQRLGTLWGSLEVTSLATRASQARMAHALAWSSGSDSVILAHGPKPWSPCSAGRPSGPQDKGGPHGFGPLPPTCQGLHGGLVVSAQQLCLDGLHHSLEPTAGTWGRYGDGLTWGQRQKRPFHPVETSKGLASSWAQFRALCWD